MHKLTWFFAWNLNVYPSFVWNATLLLSRTFLLHWSKFEPKVPIPSRKAIALFKTKFVWFHESGSFEYLYNYTLSLIWFWQRRQENHEIVWFGLIYKHYFPIERLTYAKKERLLISIFYLNFNLKLSAFLFSFCLFLSLTVKLH